MCKFGCFRGSLILNSTWINDGVLFTESYFGVSAFSFGPLDFQVAFFNGQEGDALVVSCVELC